MTVRPTIFSGPMVRALMSRRKTQTRRLKSKAQPGNLLDGAVWDQYPEIVKNA